MKNSTSNENDQNCTIAGENSENFQRYDDLSVERIEEDDEWKISEIIENFKSIQVKNLRKHGRGLHGTHRKTQGLVKETLTVHENLSSHLSQGLFKHPGEYLAIVRYANELTQIEDDRIEESRGLAMKAFNVSRIPLNLHISQRFNKSFCRMFHSMF